MKPCESNEAKIEEAQLKTSSHTRQFVEGFLSTLHCSNSVRMHRIVIVFLSFFDQHSIHHRIVQAYFLIELLQFLPDLSYMVLHDLSPVGLRFKDLHFGS